MRIIPDRVTKIKILKILIIFSVILFMDGVATGQLVHEGSSEFKPGSEPDGFRGIKWGTDISTLKDMVFIDAIYRDMKRYERRGDELKIGEAKLDYIQYEFRKGRFYLVEMWFKGGENFNQIKETMFEIYGKGRSMTEKTEGYFWEGEKTDMIMIYDSEVGGGIMISSK